MGPPRSVGIVYNPRIPGAQELVPQLTKRLGLREGPVVCSLQDLEQIGKAHPGVDLLITVGGDGTILRAVHAAAPHGVVILGINMGRVGFMTELRAEEAVQSLDSYLNNDTWIEERAMLQARIGPAGDKETTRRQPVLHHVLNEVVVGTRAVARMAAVEVAINGAPLTVFRADSVIVATATGSTGYALSAGGPILHPLSRDMVLKPVASYQGLSSALVLPASSRIQLTPRSENPAMLSIDGFIDVELGRGDQVLVEASSYVARFLRAGPPSQYYAVLTQRLGLNPGDTSYS